MMKSPLKFLFILPILMGGSELYATSSISTVDKYAYGANVGWINFAGDTTNGVVTGDFVLSGYAYAANAGWIHFGDGSPSNGLSYKNGNKDDYGVNVDDLGNLSGYAYAANFGWINFGWATTSDASRPRINLSTGYLEGYAYAANVGWLNLGSNYLVTTELKMTDTDGDGISDQWEVLHFNALATADATSDTDGDGVLDKDEYIANTDPTEPGSYLKITSHSYDSGLTEVTLSFDCVAGRMYRIEYCEDLVAPWTDSSLGLFAPDAGLSTTKLITFPTNTRKFFRVVAVRPLSL